MIWFQIELPPVAAQAYLPPPPGKGRVGANRLLVLDQKPSDREHDTEEHDHLAIKLSALKFLKSAPCQVCGGTLTARATAAPTQIVEARVRLGLGASGIASPSPRDPGQTTSNRRGPCGRSRAFLYDFSCQTGCGRGRHGRARERTTPAK